MNEISTISFFKVYQTTSHWRIIDVRDPKEFDDSHISGSINIPLNLLLEKHFLFINKTKHYYIICKNGSRSIIACKKLSECGYNVTNVVGGIMRWPGSFVRNSERAYY